MQLVWCADDSLLTATVPRRFYFYYMFALAWDKSLLPALPQPHPHEHEEGDAPAAPNGRAHQRPHYDQKSVYLTASKPVRPPLPNCFLHMPQGASEGAADQLLDDLKGMSLPANNPAPILHFRRSC